MSLLATPFFGLIWRTPVLRRGAMACVLLALLASDAEITIVLSLVPILASLGVGAGTELSDFVSRIPPAAWLLQFALAPSTITSALQTLNHPGFSGGSIL